MPRKKELSAEDQVLRVRLGAAIRVASGQRGFRPADLAAAAGVSLAHQYRIEGGEQTADFLYLVKVAALLGTSVDGLLAQGSEAPAGVATQIGTASGGTDRKQQINIASDSVQILGSKNRVTTKRT